MYCVRVAFEHNHHRPLPMGAFAIPFTDSTFSLFFFFSFLVSLSLSFPESHGVCLRTHTMQYYYFYMVPSYLSVFPSLHPIETAKFSVTRGVIYDRYMI